MAGVRRGGKKAAGNAQGSVARSLTFRGGGRI
jgi:hypothetical protein